MDLRRRVKDRVTAWCVAVEHITETQSSVLVFGRRGDQPVVVKVVKHPGDEWLSGAVLQAFDGSGTVRVFEYVDGALLLECLRPGDSLTGKVHDGRDDEATDVLADVIGRMSPSRAFANIPTVEDWGRGFERHEARANSGIPKPLFDSSRRVFFELSATQGTRRLLHGDLHHDNILLDRDRGWLAIDPKGVVGESEYEVGAALRNPYERPELFTERRRSPAESNVSNANCVWTVGGFWRGLLPRRFCRPSGPSKTGSLSDRTTRGLRWPTISDRCSRAMTEMTFESPEDAAMFGFPAKIVASWRSASRASGCGRSQRTLNDRSKCYGRPAGRVDRHFHGFGRGLPDSALSMSSAAAAPIMGRCAGTPS